MSVNNEIIISPPFTDSSWSLPYTCSFVSKDKYSCVFNTTIEESGLSFKIPNSWHGKTITISFEISDNACIRIQYTDTWEMLCELSTGNSPFTLVIPDSGTRDNISLAIVSPKTTNTTITVSSFEITTNDLTNYMYFTDIDVSNFFIGNVEVKKIYLKDKLIYENIKVADVEDTLYNKVTSTLFVLKENALYYDDQELNLDINNDIVNVEYDEENSNLNIGGDK